MRLTLAILGLALLPLAACAPQVPDSAAGVGFGDYGSYMRERERERERQAAQARSAPMQSAGQSAAQSSGQTFGQPFGQSSGGSSGGTSGGSGAPSGGEAQSIAAAALAAVRPSGGGQGQGQGQGQAAPGGTGAPMAAGAAMIGGGFAGGGASGNGASGGGSASPAAAPSSGGGSGPNIVAYALSTTHSVGTQRYRRTRLTVQNHARNCASFASSDLAQEEFLRRGGPERDPLNLDPDGDGFACRWSPEPFRAAARAAN